MTVPAVKIFAVLLTATIATVIGQREKIVKHEDIKITEFNKDFADEARINVYWHNTTTQAFGGAVTLKKEVGFDDNANVTIYKLSNNHYRVLYQLELRKRPCEYLAENKMGVQDLAKRMNIGNCPIQKGHYAVDNVIPDLSTYPLHLVPPGGYKIVFSLYDKNIYLGSGYWQGQVVPADP